MLSPFAALTRTDSHAPLGDDEEEETIYVALELGPVDPSLIPNCRSMNLLGLETPNPILLLGDSAFRGLHASTLGTEIVFNDAHPDAPSRSLAPMTHIEHKVLLNPVQIKPKAETEAAPTPRDPETPAAASGGSAQRRPAVRRAGRPSKAKGSTDPN